MADRLRAGALDAQLEKGTDFETFFAEAPALNPSRGSITGVVCGVRVEDIEDPLMQEIRYLDKLVDELAKGQGDGEDSAPVGTADQLDDRPALTKTLPPAGRVEAPEHDASQDQGRHRAQRR